MGPETDSTTRILLAEDDNDMRRFLVKALENAGYQVASFDNGLSAYNRLREEPFELLLTEELVLRREIQSGLKFTPKLIDKIVDAEQSAETAKTMQFEPMDPFDLSPAEHSAPVFLQKGVQP